MNPFGLREELQLFSRGDRDMIDGNVKCNVHTSHWKAL